jgi:hypothetical protein
MSAAAPDLEATAEASSRSVRLMQLGLRVDGVQFDLARYAHLLAIIDDDHPKTVVIKGAQLGFTVAYILKAIDRAKKGHRGMLYMFPTDRDVGDFSKARFKRILAENPPLSALVRDTDATNIKKIGETFGYFTGARSITGLKSRPIDDLYKDERDDMDDAMVELADHRLDASDDPHNTELGTPTVPDYGVDLSYSQSDQRMWHLKCRKCNGWTCKELNWPDCLAVQDDGHAFYVCSKCKEELEPVYGEWVPAHPERCTETTRDAKGRVLELGTGTRGWWVNQLNSPSKLRTPTVIADEYDLATRKGKLREFFNSVLGTAYAEVEAQLTDQLLRSCCGKDPRQNKSEGPCAMGVDVGMRDFHFEIRERVTDEFSTVVNWGVRHSFDEIADLMSSFNVQICVMDEMAESRSVATFKAKHREVYGCWYSDPHHGPHKWQIPDQKVTVNRTESLDESHMDIVDRKVEFPREDELFREVVAPQMKNLSRVYKRRDDQLGIGQYRTGQRTPVWVILGGVKNDHLRHADNYARIALGRVALVERVRRASKRERYSRPGKRRRGWQAG